METRLITNDQQLRRYLPNAFDTVNFDRTGTTVIDTGALPASPKALPVRADGRFFEVGLSQTFLEICD